MASCLVSEADVEDCHDQGDQQEAVASNSRVGDPFYVVVSFKIHYSINGIILKSWKKLESVINNYFFRNYYYLRIFSDF